MSELKCPKCGRKQLNQVIDGFRCIACKSEFTFKNLLKAEAELARIKGGLTEEKIVEKYREIKSKHIKFTNTSQLADFAKAIRKIIDGGEK